MAAWIEFFIFLTLLTLLTPLLGGYMAAVFEGGPHVARRVAGPCERAIYRICRIDAVREMNWREYLWAVVLFSGVSAFALFCLLLVQKSLPLNPQGFANFSPLLAFNVAVSFMTTTDWQAYSGESSLGYLAQMAGLAWQNFLAAAIGIAVAIAAIRGFTRSSALTLGNFWVDLTRAWLYVLLPLSIIGALALAQQGTPQNFAPYLTAHTLEGAAQTLTGGPIASQEIIKQLGVNGGGFVGANSAAPLENPTPLSDFIQCLAMFLIGAGLTNTFGRLVGNVRQGWMLYAVMAVLFAAGFAGIWGAEHAGNPLVHALGTHGPNLEGKEARFGDASALSITVATDTSSGASNVAYDSLMPLTTFVVLLNMQIGEVIFGGAGSGLYGMLLLAILTVFIAGLMVGRTPDYLGKRIEQREITLVVGAALIPAIATLVPTAFALLPGFSAVGTAGAHGFAEILYAFTSVAANNGSAMAGLGTQTDGYTWLTAAVMLVGRFGTLAIVLALAGGLARKPRVLNAPEGRFSTTTPLFGALLAATAIVVTALTFIPADALGPLAEAYARTK